MWYKYRCLGSLMKEEVTVSCRWSKHWGNYYSEIQKQRFLLLACISCLAGSCGTQPWSNPSLILRFPFSVNLTLRRNSAAADTVQVPQFVLCLPHLHIPFSFSVPSCIRCPLSDRGDSWRSFLGGLKHGMFRLQTAWSHVKVILPRKALWMGRVRSEKHLTLQLALGDFHSGEHICFSLGYLNLLKT